MVSTGNENVNRRNGSALEILFLIGAENFGGAERQLAALASGLHAKGRRVAVALCHTGLPLQAELASAGVPTVKLERRGRMGVIGFVWRSIRAVRREKPQVVHGYLHGPNLLAVLLRPFTPKARVVWGIRDSNMDRSRYTTMHRVKFFVTRSIARFADVIIVNSAAGVEHHRREGFPDRTMIVVPNGIDTDRFRPDPALRRAIRAEWRVQDDDVVVGLVARLDPMKDHETFLRAASALAVENPRLRFVCVGSGQPEYEEHLKGLSRQWGLETRVVWAGARNDIEAVQNAFDIACSSSAFGEGFSNTVGEAMATGVPCVVTDVGDSASVVGETGVVVPVGNPDALADGIAQMLRRRSPELQHACRERIVECFSISKLVERTETALSLDA